MSNELTIANQFKVQDIERMAAAIAKSGLFGIKTPEQGIALMLIAQAEGMHPAIAARDFHIVQGRPTLKADAMLARFQTAGGKVEWHQYTDSVCEATFTHPQGGKVKLAWTMEMAHTAKLTSKDVWKQYPRAMLRSRVISEGIRTIFPGVAVGVYTPEEMEAMEVKGPPREVDSEVLNKPSYQKPVLNSPIEEVLKSTQEAVIQAHKEEVAKVAPVVAPKPTHQFDSRRKAVMDKIPHIKWKKEQLKEYSGALLGKYHSEELTTDELEQIVNVALISEFTVAMDEVLQQSMFDKS